LAKNCIFIDDSYKNLKPANDLGIKTVQFVRGPAEKDYPPDYKMSDFTELERIIRRMF